MVALPQITERQIRPFVFIGTNTNGELSRRKMLNEITLQLGVLHKNIQFVVCDTFDRELIYRIRTMLGIPIEEYPMFTDDFSNQLFFMQKYLGPNLYQGFGLDDLQKRAMMRVSHYRHIPFVVR